MSVCPATGGEHDCPDWRAEPEAVVGACQHHQDWSDVGGVPHCRVRSFVLVRCRTCFLPVHVGRGKERTQWRIPKTTFWNYVQEERERCAAHGVGVPVFTRVREGAAGSC